VSASKLLVIANKRYYSVVAINGVFAEHFTAAHIAGARHLFDNVVCGLLSATHEPILDAAEQIGQRHFERPRQLVERINSRPPLTGLNVSQRHNANADYLRQLLLR